MILIYERIDSSCEILELCGKLFSTSFLLRCLVVIVSYEMLLGPKLLNIIVLSVALISFLLTIVRLCAYNLTPASWQRIL